MSNKDIPFYGLVFFEGREHFPDDIKISLKNYRNWAIQNNLVSDPEFQFLTGERIDELKKIVEPGDPLQVALVIHTKSGEPFYFEYPYLPVKTLINRDIVVGLQYWRIRPTEWNKEGKILHYGEVRFGYLFPECNVEFCSLSTAKRVTAKLSKLLRLLLSDKKYLFNRFPDGSKEITVDGAIGAKFFKDGRHYDMKFLR